MDLDQCYKYEKNIWENKRGKCKNIKKDCFPLSN